MNAANEDRGMSAEDPAREGASSDLRGLEAIPLPMDADLHRSGSTIYLMLRSAHSLRTTFHSCLGFMDIVASDMLSGLDNRYQPYLKESEVHLRTISSLLEETIEMARVETGVETIRTEATRVDTLFGLAAQRLIRRDITVEWDIPEHLMVAADMPRFIRALYNLLVSFSADRGGAYFVEAREQGKDGMLGFWLSGTMNAGTSHTRLSTGGMAAMGPEINLECFRGWINLMGGSVLRATINPDGMEMIFLLRQSSQDKH